MNLKKKYPIRESISIVYTYRQNFRDSQEIWLNSIQELIIIPAVAYMSHCWAQASQYKRASAIVPTRVQCRLGTSHSLLNGFAGLYRISHIVFVLLHDPLLEKPSIQNLWYIRNDILDSYEKDRIVLMEGSSLGKCSEHNVGRTLL